MRFPWRELKEAEVRLLAAFSEGQPSDEAREELRELIGRVALAPDADEAICFHGASSLLAELDGDLRSAIESRKNEIRQIERLHELARKNPGDAAALKGCDEADLQVRRDILARLEEAV